MERYKFGVSWSIWCWSLSHAPLSAVVICELSSLVAFNLQDRALLSINDFYFLIWFPHILDMFARGKPLWGPVLKIEDIEPGYILYLRSEKELSPRELAMIPDNKRGCLGHPCVVFEKGVCS